jgi:subtilisin family serine protease
MGTEKKTAYGGNAPRAGLHIYKVLTDDGSGQDSWIIKALDHIAEQNENSPDLVIHGINFSLGGPFDPEVYGCGFSPLCNELRRLWRQGVLVCIAAGNEGRLVLRTLDGIHDLNLDLSIGDPANLEEAIAVGSVHRESPHLYGISYFSSRGPTADGRRKPDVVAPGEKIVSANAAFETEEDYVAMSGTSMACPQVSGVLAAFLSVRREFIGRPDMVKRILLDHCVDLGRDPNFQGAGVPNLMQMLLTT